MEGNENMNKLTQYVSEMKAEISKVSWPTREELLGSTGVVVVLCLVLSVFVFAVDFALNRLLEIIF
jgi:preprotein translocase subunit SecE